MNWDIQKAQAGDAAGIADFQIEMALESEGLALDRETVENGVKAALEDDSKGLYFVAKDESGTVAGSLFLTKEWSDWHNNTGDIRPERFTHDFIENQERMTLSL